MSLSAKGCTDERWEETACSRGAMPVPPSPSPPCCCLKQSCAVPACLSMDGGQHSAEEAAASSPGLWASILVSPLHLDTPLLLPCGHVPSLLLFVPSLLPAASCLDTIPLDSSTRRKTALDIFRPQLLPHLLLALQVTIPVVKHSLPTL